MTPRPEKYEPQSEDEAWRAIFNGLMATGLYDLDEALYELRRIKEGVRRTAL